MEQIMQQILDIIMPEKELKQSIRLIMKWKAIITLILQSNT